MCLVANTRRGNLIYIDTTASAAEDRINQKVAYVILTATAASASLILEETSGSGDVVRFDKAAAGTEVFPFPDRPMVFPTGIYVKTLTNAVATLVMTEGGK